MHKYTKNDQIAGQCCDRTKQGDEMGMGRGKRIAVGFMIWTSCFERQLLSCYLNDKAETRQTPRARIFQAP